VTRLGAGCYVARSGNEASDYILGLIRKRKLYRIALSNSAVVNEIDLADALTMAGLKPQIVNFDNLGPQVLSERKQSVRDTLLHAEIGITGVSYGIADTGTLVIGADREYNRLASLLPAVHLAIVRSDQLMPNLHSTLERISTSGQINQAVTLITGPSRTADIELTLTIGVHGPKELQVVLLKS
jgi:L-lactate dehydrogenase complex protein LldG